MGKKATRVYVCAGGGGGMAVSPNFRNGGFLMTLQEEPEISPCRAPGDRAGMQACALLGGEGGGAPSTPRQPYQLGSLQEAGQACGRETRSPVPAC